MVTLGINDYTTCRRDVLVHEIAHQWYGDEVTPGDWRDLWMSEGMAMYLQGSAGEHDRRPLDARACDSPCLRPAAARRVRSARPPTTRASSARATSTTRPR